MKLGIGNWKFGWRFRAAGLLLIVAGKVVSGACVGDVRTVSVESSPNGPRLLVKMVRAYAGDGAIEPLTLRPDARKPMVSVGGVPSGAATNLVRFLAAAAREGWKVVETGKDGYGIPPPAADSVTLVYAEFLAPDSFPGGLWWASYVPPEPKGLKECVFRLQFPHDGKVAVKTAGEWKLQTGALDGRETREWLLSAPAIGGTFVLVGSEASWDGVGRAMAGQLTRRESGARDEPLPGDLAKLDRIDGDSKRLEKALEIVSAMGKKAASAGLRAAPVQDTVTAGAGNCKDLALLFIRAVQSVGMEPLVVYRASGMKSLEGVLPCPYVFDHVLVAVVVAESMCFFDPYDGTQRVENDLQMDGDVLVNGNMLIVRIE